MGIKNLNKFLKTNLKYTPLIVKLEDLSGSTIAVDAPPFLFHIKYNPNWENRLETYLNLYEINNIKLVFVLEGVAPKEKKNTHLKRAELKSKAKEITERFKVIKSNLELNNQPSDDDVIFWKNRRATSRMNFKDEPLNIFSLNAALSQRERVENTAPKQEDWIKFEAIVSKKYQVIHAPGEAEHFCAQLYHSNLCDYVWSADSDTLTYGCGFVIDKIENNTVSVYVLSDILNKMQMSFDSFLSFCICCGCDYNEGIFKKGPVTMYDVCKDGKCLELLTKDEIEKLNYFVCKDIFLSARVPLRDDIIVEQQLKYTPNYTYM